MRTAPDGGVFLGITWTFGPGDMQAFDKVFGQPLPLKMTLTSGGKEYPLAPPRLTLDGRGERRLLRRSSRATARTR